MQEHGYCNHCFRTNPNVDRSIRKRGRDEVEQDEHQGGTRGRESEGEDEIPDELNEEEIARLVAQGEHAEVCSPYIL